MSTLVHALHVARAWNNGQAAKDGAADAGRTRYAAVERITMMTELVIDFIDLAMAPMSPG